MDVFYMHHHLDHPVNPLRRRSHHRHDGARSPNIPKLHGEAQEHEAMSKWEEIVPAVAHMNPTGPRLGRAATIASSPTAAS
jgi:hypothetical protein